MKSLYNWSKGLFSNTYNIYSGSTLIGKLKDKSFSQSANGSLNGKEYLFKTKGFFNQHTDIINSSDNRVIGRINYNSWKTKAQIVFTDRTVVLRAENIWNTKWILFDSNGILLNYSGSSTKGRIEAIEDSELLVLIGLFVINYYWQSSLVILIIVFLPIWLTLFS